MPNATLERATVGNTDSLCYQHRLAQTLVCTLKAYYRSVKTIQARDWLRYHQNTTPDRQDDAGTPPDFIVLRIRVKPHHGRCGVGRPRWHCVCRQGSQGSSTGSLSLSGVCGRQVRDSGEAGCCWGQGEGAGTDAQGCTGAGTVQHRLTQRVSGGQAV